MNGLDQAWALALHALDGRLTVRHESADDRDEILALLRRTTFPGRLALLGSTATCTGGDGDAFVATAAAKAAAVDRGLAEAVLRHLLRGEEGAAAESGVERTVLDAAVRTVAGEHLPMRPEQIAVAVELLRSGEFYDDLAHGSALVLRLVPSLPSDVLHDVVALPGRPQRVLGSVARDVAELLRGDAAGFVRHFVRGDAAPRPRLFGRTLSVLYEVATVRQLATAIRGLLAGDNESFRLAVLVYARPNGIALEAKHLDALRDEVLAEDAPDLAPVLVAALEQQLAAHDREALLSMLLGLAKRET
jgi:hypothetical protein